MPPPCAQRVRGSWCLTRGFDLVFQAVAFAFDDDGLGVVEHAVEDGAGDAGVVIEDLRPVFVGSDLLTPAGDSR